MICWTFARATASSLHQATLSKKLTNLKSSNEEVQCSGGGWGHLRRCEVLCKKAKGLDVDRLYPLVDEHITIVAKERMSFSRLTHTLVHH